MFTSDDRKRLKSFCEICDAIAACRFIREFHKQPHHIFVGKLPDGRIVDEYPRYDDDDFRAFLTHYRKLRLTKSPENLLRVLKLVKWKGDPSDRPLLDHLKYEISEEGRSWWGAAVPDGNGGKAFLTQEGLEDLILNGDVFHSDKKEELLQVLGKSSLVKAVAFLNYLRFARTIAACGQKMTELIRSKGYLA